MDERIRPGLKELKDFGLGLSVILALIVAVAASRHSPRLPGWAVACAASVAFTSLYPAFFLWPYRAWMPAARVLARVNTFLLTAVMYYAVFAPVGCVMRLFGRDLLEEGWDAKASTYWKPKEPRTDPARYERMF
ncbi:MAG: SxtJ family membrane protein [Elusimicrobia bacterium]|nr:SxtJ family membrane protein [Elusimicrobiota bacterium]